MATFAWGVDDGVTATAAVLQVLASVSSSPFVLATPVDQDFRIICRFETFTLDAATNGPFQIQSSVESGGNSVTVGVGVGSNFSALDFITLRGASGEEMVCQVDDTFAGGDVIQLRERSRINLPSPVATIEIVPSMTISGFDGGVLKTEGPYALSDPSKTANLFRSRLRYDAGTVVTVTLSGLDNVTQVAINTCPDEWNVYVSDRNSPRASSGSTVAPLAPKTYVTSPWLEGGAGSPSLAGGLINGGQDNYANTRVSTRALINVSAGSVFTGGVDIFGFRTYAQARDVVAIGAGFVQVFKDQYSQFHPGDVVTLLNVQSGTHEVQTISTKTAPDVLNFVGVTTGGYAQDSLVGLEVTENIPVIGGVAGGQGPSGEYVSTEAYAYVSHHQTANGGEDFTYDLSNSVQGHAGALMAASHRQGNGIATTGAAQNECIIQCATRIVVDADTTFGGAGSILSTPRNHDALIGNLGGFDDSYLYLGMRHHLSGLSASPHVWMRGFAAGSNDGYQWSSPVTSLRGGVLLFGLISIGRKLVVGSDAGRNDVAPGNIARYVNVRAYTRNFYRQNTSDVFASDVYSAIDKAGSLFAAGSGADYQVNAATGIVDFSSVQSTDAYARAFASLPTAPLAFGDPIRIKGLNSDGLGAQAGASRRFTLLGGAFSHEARAISSYVSQVEIQGNGSAQKRFTSAVLLRTCIINEVGDLLPGARVQVFDIFGTAVVDEITDSFGEIPAQEIISHQFDQINVAGTSIWALDNDGGSPPVDVTLTAFSPFVILVTPSGSALGYIPSRAEFAVKCAFGRDVNLTLVLLTPRVLGQSGDAAGEFF